MKKVGIVANLYFAATFSLPLSSSLLEFPIVYPMKLRHGFTTTIRLKSVGFRMILSKILLFICYFFYGRKLAAMTRYDHMRKLVLSPLTIINYSNKQIVWEPCGQKRRIFCIHDNINDLLLLKFLLIILIPVRHKKQKKIPP